MHTNVNLGANSYFDKNTKATPVAGRRRESTAEAAPDRVGKGEQGEARRANRTPDGGPPLELGHFRLKNWSKSDFSIAQTTGQRICCTCVS